MGQDKSPPRGGPPPRSPSDRADDRASSAPTVPMKPIPIPGTDKASSAPTVPMRPIPIPGTDKAASAPTVPMRPIPIPGTDKSSAPTVPMKAVPIPSSDADGPGPIAAPLPESSPDSAPRSRQITGSRPAARPPEPPKPPPSPEAPQRTAPRSPAVAGTASGQKSPGEPPGSRTAAMPAGQETIRYGQPAVGSKGGTAPASEATRVSTSTQPPQKPPPAAGASTAASAPQPIQVIVVQRPTAPPSPPAAAAEPPPAEPAKPKPLASDVRRKPGESTSVMLKANKLLKMLEQSKGANKDAPPRRPSPRSMRAPFVLARPGAAGAGASTSPAKIVLAPVESYPGQRAAHLTQNVINQYAVATNPRYSAKNQELGEAGHLFVFDVMNSLHTSLGSAFPAGPGTFRPGTLTEIWKWLHQTASSQGWRVVEGTALLDAMARGLPVIALATTAAGPRLAVVEPGAPGPGGKPRLASAYEPRGQQQPPEKLFGSSPVRYLAHD